MCFKIIIKFSQYSCIQLIYSNDLICVLFFVWYSLLGPFLPLEFLDGVLLFLPNTRIYGFCLLWSIAIHNGFFVFVGIFGIGFDILYLNPSCHTRSMSINLAQCRLRASPLSLSEICVEMVLVDWPTWRTAHHFGQLAYFCRLRTSPAHLTRHSWFWQLLKGASRCLVERTTICVWELLRVIRFSLTDYGAVAIRKVGLLESWIVLLRDLAGQKTNKQLINWFFTYSGYIGYNFFFEKNICLPEIN